MNKRNDTIFRSDVIDAIERGLKEPAYYHADEDWYAGMNSAAIIVEGLPSAGKTIGMWKKVNVGLTPGGTPYYECGKCGGSGHLHGIEYPRRKVICDICGRVNIYPWETAFEHGSSLWEDDYG